MSNHFNDLLLQTLKEVGLRLDRVEGRLERVEDRLDRVVEQKADKSDIVVLRDELRALDQQLETKADKSDVATLHDELRAQGERLDGEIRAQGQRLDRIETGIKTLQWTMTAGIAVMGIILAFIRAC